MDNLRLDKLGLSAVADRVVAWHNRHPLARRISAAQVHAIGYVALPFTGEAPLPSTLPSAAQAAAQAIAAAAAAPLPVASEVASEVAQAAATQTQAPAEGSRLRERALSRAREQAAEPHSAHAADTAAAVLATLAPATLKRDFSENFIDTLSARQVARFALKHGRVLARAPLDAPVREVRADGSASAPGMPERRKRVSAQVYVLTAVIETDTRKSRVLLGGGTAVLGQRIHSSPRITAMLALAAGALGAPLWLMLLQAPAQAPVQMAAPAPAQTPTQAAVPASAAVPVAAATPAASAVLPVLEAVPTPPQPAAEAPVGVPMLRPAIAPPAVPEIAARRRVASIVPVLSDEQKALAREERQALIDAAGASSTRSLLSPSSGPPSPSLPMPAPVASAPAVADRPTRLPAAAPVSASAPPVIAAPPAGPVFAISTRALRTRAEADQVRVAMQALLQTLGHAGMQVDVLPQGDDWRVVALPFPQRADAEKGRALLASRGMRVAVLDF